MTYPENCIIKKGYFPETATGLDDNYVFVSLDADLYNLTLAGLRAFYPKMTKGGFIFIHDYFNEFFIGVSQAVCDYEKEIGITLSKIPIGDLMSIAIVKV